MKTREFLCINDALRVVPLAEDIHTLRQFNFMNKDQPASVGRLLSELGFSHRFEQLPNAVSARLDPDTWSDKGYEVVVNAAHSRQRQRFSALHEVGHYFCHVDRGDPLEPVRYRASGYTFDAIYDFASGAEEIEANHWADSVIFGGRALEGALGLLGRNTRQLSRHFGFSEDVVERALKRRGL